MSPEPSNGRGDKSRVPGTPPELYEYLELEDYLYAIRLPSNQVLHRQIAHLLTRPVGRPPNKPVVLSYSFQLIKIGAKVVTHARYVIFQMAEVAVPHKLFCEILRRIHRLREPGPG